MLLPPALTCAACGNLSILFNSSLLNSMLIDAPLSRYSLFAGKPAQLTRLLVVLVRDLMKLFTFSKIPTCFSTVVSFSGFTVSFFFFFLFLRFFFGFDLALLVTPNFDGLLAPMLFGSFQAFP